jgi:integrase
MATAKKLPSGSWRCQVYSHKDESGKRIYESFTSEDPSPKGKREAEFMAAEFAMNKKEKKSKSLTSTFLFREARQKYIDLKSGVLSPATIRGYEQMKTYYSGLDDLALKDIDSIKVQEWVNDFYKTHSAKTVRNAHSLLNSTFKEFCPDNILQITLPKKKKIVYKIPTDDEIKLLINYLNDNDKEMLIAVYLAAFGTLRRSEVCGLSAGDVNGNIIHVNMVLVKDKDGNLIEKELAKTDESDRYVELPKFVIDTFPSGGKIVSITPDTITRRFQRTLIKLEISPFRYHDLRHYAASIMHAIGIPDQYIMRAGGWKSDAILKSIYRGTLNDYEKKFSSQANEYFSDMQHEMQHKKSED